MSSLPIELLEIVLINLEADDRSDLFRASRVCRRWHTLALPRAYSTIVFSSLAQVERCAKILAETPTFRFEDNDVGRARGRHAGGPLVASAETGEGGPSSSLSPRWKRRSWGRSVFGERLFSKERFFSLGKAGGGKFLGMGGGGSGGGGSSSSSSSFARPSSSSSSSVVFASTSASASVPASGPALSSSSSSVLLPPSLPRYGDFVTALDFSNVPKLTDKLFRNVVRLCPRVRSICLWHCYMIHDSSITLLGSLSALENLELGENDYLTGSSLASLRLGALRSIRIGPGFRGLETRHLVAASARGGWANLTRLSLDVTGADQADLVALLGHVGATLTHLQFRELRPEHSFLTTLTSRCVRIQHLDISGVRLPWTPRSTSPFNLPRNLVSFNASGLGHIQPFLHALTASAQTLRKLYLAGTRLAPDLLTDFVSKCPRLERLDVSNAKLNVDDWRALASSECAPNLTKLRARDCYWLNDEGLEILARAMPKVVVLDVSGCLGLTSTALHTITRMWGPTLKALQIHRCRFDDRFSLLWIPDRCQRLRCLDLGDQMSSLDGETLMDVLRGCPNLVELCVGVDGLSDAMRDYVNPMVERANRRHWRQNSIRVMW